MSWRDPQGMIAERVTEPVCDEDLASYSRRPALQARDEGPVEESDAQREAIRQLACDLIIAAVEGGINHWSHVSDYRWGDPNLGHSDRRPWSEGDTPYASVTVHEDEGDEKVVYVGVAKMVEVIRKVVAGDVEPFYNRGYSQTLRERLIALLDQLEQGVPYSETDFDSDADDADNLMQLAVLGEIVYG
jgi:hypothetical protein